MPVLLEFRSGSSEGSERIHQIHRCQHATDDAGKSKHRLPPNYLCLLYHNRHNLNFTASDYSSDEMFLESVNSVTVDATGREHIPIINNSIRKNTFS